MIYKIVRGGFCFISTSFDVICFISDHCRQFSLFCQSSYYFTWETLCKTMPGSSFCKSQQERDHSVKVCLARSYFSPDFLQPIMNLPCHTKTVLRASRKFHASRWNWRWNRCHTKKKKKKFAVSFILYPWHFRTWNNFKKNVDRPYY